MGFIFMTVIMGAPPAAILLWIWYWAKSAISQRATRIAMRHALVARDHIT